jgi:predicted metal-dependent HD superfamily phosphohydrolase
MTGYFKLRRKALNLLRTELSEDLRYHGIAHTLRVLKVCNEYIRREKVSRDDAQLLRTGAICHDLGFTVSYYNHEEHSVVLAMNLMIQYGYSDKNKKVVIGLINATKIPQSPKNHLEKILCDADLDYLGSNDYKKISDFLFQELNAFGQISSREEWREIQISFLEKHKYHTPFALKNRRPAKEKRLRELREQKS